MTAHTRFRLRYAGQEAILAQGEHVIGRSPECDVVLDDPMASRRHAVLRVSAEGVVLEDLGSRNGVLVNGVRMFDPVTLSHGDRFLVGGTDFYLVEAARRRREEMATRPLQSSGVRMGVPSSAPPSAEADWGGDSTGTGSVYDVLVAACDRALSQGDVTEAAPAVRNLLLSVRAAMVRRQAPDPHTVGAVTGYALQMADRTGDPSWLDRLFEVLAAGRWVPDDVAVERVARVVQRLGLGGVESVRGYVARMSDRVAELDTDARRRLDQLAQVVAQVGT
ncbi:MAG: FHA domain-containing protein [Myxococcota bacterium]